MAKAKALEVSADDLIPADARTKRERAAAATRTRAEEPSADLVPLQFKMPREFVRAFKAEALKRDMKLNAFLKSIFEESMKA